MSGPLPSWCVGTCVVCPARVLGPGRFDVTDQPGPDYRYNRQIGWRVDAEGNAVCVHPYRVGLPVGRYASADQPLPDPSVPAPRPTAAALELPADVVDLEGWLVATLRVAVAGELPEVIARAEELAVARFTPAAVTTALRRVLSHELTHPVA
ncbi:MAG: hypothetical protein ACRDSR_10210 [Pseudonocardiaceae bacterium]